ncbi:transketolase C-terminal domain-containing protein [Saccharolobus islandicus]|uniref:2-oxoacid oxidoreductase (ferredoxin) n=1 Tax=Saccharolobus islandicus LAL14/1 TaxID=1241935 RepID=M9U6Q0_SACIS|nr:transketolase C-terminal domain-containing protein [Sulfolobus islandicus]AGJ61827.1 Pyruvate:ferredoxin oxidoreductase-related 2-oxoacid:ferredoxin oxidoreductase, alpha subunit [Sulfolobus islandicus LAL14/1]
MQVLKRKALALVGNHAVAYAVKQSKPQVLAVFPITPQTTMLEKISEYIASEELNAELIKVESEHSALASIYGAALAGARVFTATSSQGLLYMTEMIYWAGGQRVPMVAAVATRAIAEPWSIWDDHQDFLSKRDAIWIQMMAENVQEAYDMTIQAFRISEDERVILPVMMGFDGFILTHTMERIEVLEDGEVDNFLPPRQFNLIDFSDPIGVGPIATPENYIKYRYEAMEAMERAKGVIEEVMNEYERISGRKQNGLVECYKCEDAKYVFVTMGAWSGDCKVAVDRLRDAGVEAGLLKIRVFRPFPKEKIEEYLRSMKGVIVLDRAYSYGSGGILANEIKATLYGYRVPVYSVIAGIGGKDVRPRHFQKVIEDLINDNLEEERWLL